MFFGVFPSWSCRARHVLSAPRHHRRRRLIGLPRNPRGWCSPGRARLGILGCGGEGRVRVRIWSDSNDATRVMMYQTRVESDDDWELLVLNLVRRPSGIVEDCALRGGEGGEGHTTWGGRIIYTLENMSWAKPSLSRSVRGKISSLLHLAPSICRQALQRRGQ